MNPLSDPKHAMKFDPVKRAKRYEVRKKSVRFLTNVHKKYAPLVEQAARDTDYDVFVQTPAHAKRSNQMLPNRVAVYTRDERAEHGPFWQRFRELKEQA